MKPLLRKVGATYFILFGFVSVSLYNLSNVSSIFKQPNFANETLESISSENNALLDMTNFRYLLTPSCQSKDASEFETILLVTSHAKNVELRKAQRDAFTSQDLKDDLNLRRLFILATDPTVNQRAIEREATIHQDLLIGNFVEDYTLLSYKHIMGLQWAVQHCRNKQNTMQLIIKIDDDIVIDLYQFIFRLKEFGDEDLSSKLFGFQHFELEVERQGKWDYDRKQYRGLMNTSVYPNFLSGWAYACSMETAGTLVKTANSEKEIFWIDDVWVTGVLARKAGLDLVSMNPYYTVYTEHIACCLNDVGYLCNFLVGPSGGSFSLIRRFGKHLLDCMDRVPRCQRRSFTETKECPIENPLFLPRTKVIGEVIP